MKPQKEDKGQNQPKKIQKITLPQKKTIILDNQIFQIKQPVSKKVSSHNKMEEEQASVKIAKYKIDTLDW